MKKLLTIFSVFLSLAFSFTAFADDSSKNLFENSSVFISEEQKSSFRFTMISGSWNENNLENGKIEAFVQFKSNGNWTDWIELNSEDESDDLKFKSAIAITNPATSYKYKFIFYSSGKLVPYVSNVKWTLLNTSSTINASSSTKNSSKIVSRSAWGANEALRYTSVNPPSESPVTVEVDSEYLKKFAKELKYKKVVSTDANGEKYLWPLQYPEKVSKFVIHHTATVNNLENPSQAIRDIYYYHSVTRSWGDIGYNYIIAPDGTIYEGRFGGEGVIGAHAGKGNTGSIGISILGNYEENQVPQKVVDSLISLIAQKAKIHSINPSGKSLFRGENTNNILGHRDFMATTCPGKNLNALLSSIAKSANSELKSAPDKTKLDYSFKDISEIYSINLDTDQKKTIELKLKNTGTKEWDSNSYILYSQNFELNKLATFPSKKGVVLAKLNEKSVKPGKIGTFIFQVMPSANFGSTQMQIHLMVNGTKKLNESLDITFSNEVKTYDYSLVSMTKVPSTMTKNQRLQINLKLKNTGGITWLNKGDNSITLGTDLPRDSRSPFTRPPKTRLATLKEEQVKPGETGTFTFTIIAPVRSGTYKQYITPVAEGKTWMSHKNIFIETTVGEIKQSSKIENTNLKTVSKDNIRIKLSVFKLDEAKVSSGKAFSTYKDGKLMSSFSGGDIVVINEAGIKVVPSEGGILEILNLENRPRWNLNLNDNLYRGALEFQKENDKLIVINELPLEDYLKGLGEVGNADPEEKIKSIIVVARTYAKYYMQIDKKFPGKDYHLDDDPNVSQIYLGYGFEKRAAKIVKAVKDTQSMVITYKGKLVKTPYFSNTDGTRTLSAEEKWGWTDTPYLKSVSDAHCKAESFYGHGVGLSGCGATALANAGSDYISILKYYYSGVEIQKL